MKMIPLNRRNFGRSLLAAAASAMAAFGAPKKIRAGILGVQHSHLSGKLQAMRGNPAYEVVSVCEPDGPTQREHASNAMFAGLRWFPLDEMLADPSIDLIVFEGEVADAVPFGKKVLAAGKHLHLEKPPTNRLGPFQEMVELARAKDRRLQLGYLYRFHSGIDLALEAQRKGWLGDVFMIRATMNSDRDQKQRDIEARFAGGSMFELGGHMIDRVVAMLGRPASVRSWLRHDTSVRDSEKDNTLAVFEYKSALATVVSSARDASQHRSFEVIGSDGSIMINPMEPVPTATIQMREPRGPYKKGKQEIALPPQPRFIADFQDLARAIQTSTPLRYSYDHELLLQETLLRASGEIA